MLTAVIAATVASACPTADPRAALLAIHEDARKAHLTGNAELLAKGADAQVTMADGGVVRSETPGGIQAFFTGYFQRIRYSEWSDQASPIVAISPDGQTGWMAVGIAARYTTADAPDAVKSFKSSWIATYRKVGCDWKMTGIASNVVQ